MKPDVAKPANNAPNRPKEHQLSNTVATRLGCPAALLLKYLDYVVGKRGKEKDGRRWYRVNLDHLVEVYPYLSRTCIEETLKKLTANDQAPLIVHHKNSHGYDRTGNYAFRDAQIGAESRAKLRYFRPKDAVKLGIPAALLLHNLRYWAGQKNAPKDGWHTVKVKELAKLLPLTPKQIRDALKTLVEAEILEPAPPAGKQRYWRYRLIEPKPDTLTKADMGVTNPDMQVTKVDNYNSYQSSFSASLPASLEQKTNYSVRPASPTAVSGCDLLSKEPDPSLKNEAMKDELPYALSPEDEPLKKASSGGDLSPDKPAQALKVNGSHPVSANDSVRPECPGLSPDLQSSQVSVMAVQGSSASLPSAATPSIAHPAQVWPNSFEQICVQASEGLKAVDEKLHNQFEKLFEQEIENLLKDQPVEVLERWSQLQSCELLYAEFLPLFEEFEFSAIKSRDQLALHFLRTVLLLRFVEVFWHFHERCSHLSGRPYPYRIHIHLRCRLEPRRKAREDAIMNRFIAERQAEWEARRLKHRSLDEAVEGDPVQSAAAKVKVLENAINARNLTGVLNAKHEIKKNLLGYNAGSLVMAKQFFNTNPAATPAHLLAVMDRCSAYVADNPPSDGEFDPRYEIRKGTNLTSLLKYLPSIIAAAELGDAVPVFQAVQADDSEG